MRYLVEVYLPRSAGDELERIDVRARSAARRVTGTDGAISFVESIYVPEDEMCLLVYDAAGPELVHEATRQAGIACERVLRASTQTKGAER